MLAVYMNAPSQTIIPAVPQGNYGVRVQNSVFECVLTYVDYLHLRNELSHLIDYNADSLRFYPLGKNGREKVVHIGVNRGIDVEGTLVL